MKLMKQSLFFIPHGNKVFNYKLLSLHTFSLFPSFYLNTDLSSFVKIFIQVSLPTKIIYK